jgi:hypothetical protein
VLEPNNFGNPSRLFQKQVPKFHREWLLPTDQPALPMNSRSVSIILFGINLGLLGVVAYMVYLLRMGPTPARPVGRTAFVTNTVTQVAVRKVNATNLLAAFGNRPLNWSAIESTNYVTYINNLRGFGCPEETVRDIILTDIAKTYGKRRAALVGQGKGDKFWLPYPDENGDPQLRQQLAALEEEQRRLVRELLGIDFQTELAKYWQDDEVLEQRMFGFLPEEKQDQLRGLNAKFEALEQEIYTRSKGELIPEDEEKLRTLEKEKEAELAKVLTPQEMEEYQLRNSSTANTLRGQLAGFQPTEEEFRKLFKLQKTYDDQFAKAFDLTDGNAVAVQSKAQEEAQRALNDEMKKSLGEQRYNEYVRAQDGDYRSLQNLGSRFNFPNETVASIYDMKQQAEQQKQQLEANPNLTPQQRQRALAEIATLTQKSISDAMGERAFKAYQQGTGRWLSSLGVSAVPEVQVDASQAQNTTVTRPRVGYPPTPPGFPVFPAPFIPAGVPPNVPPPPPQVNQ